MNGIEKNSEKPTYPDLTLELESMFMTDQDMRKKNLEDGDFWIDGIDKKHTERMREIVAQIGWPTSSKVGEIGAHHAWLLVQHADHDVVFQEMCLELMKMEPDNEVSAKDIAYLEDRVRVNKGQHQLYGTQFTEEGSQRIPKPIENEAEVNERRKKVGLDTIEEYTAQMYEVYGKPGVKSKK